jgi:hypothetical protein
LLRDWSFDSLQTVRSALPATVLAALSIASGSLYAARPNLVPGVPAYLYGPQYPGGKAFNPAAFVTPVAGTQGSLGRNALRGVGAWQADFSVHRQFSLTERLSVQARADFFNLFNHPNFGLPITTLTSPVFGQATQMLAPSLGSSGLQGGLNQLYQFGGPRSAQLSLKVRF